MYTEINFKTKKALKEAFKAGQQIRVFQPGGIFPGKTDGTVALGLISASAYHVCGAG